MMVYGAGCIVYCNKVSKPIKGKYLLLCMNSIVFPTNFIHFNRVLKSFKSLCNEH